MHTEVPTPNKNIFPFLSIDNVNSVMVSVTACTVHVERDLFN